jgi:large-conductance mechanosensitive channel
MGITTTFGCGQSGECPHCKLWNLITQYNFLIVAFVVFIIVRHVNTIRSKADASGSEQKGVPYCKETISLAAVRAVRNVRRGPGIPEVIFIYRS